MFNIHETSEDVFQSGEPFHQHEWNKIIEVGKDRGKPVAVIDLRDERNLEKYRIPCPEGWANIWLPIPDWAFSIYPDYLMVDFFRKAGNICKTLHEQGFIVWIHCAAGISRSTAVNMAYRMIAKGETVDVALEAIRRVRSFAGPNQHFRSALLDLEEELFGKRISEDEDQSEELAQESGLKEIVRMKFGDPEQENE